MPTLAATLSYNGAPFHGFARQEGLQTVQGELESALEMLYRRPVETVCAGRTDAGVHALGQVISFDLDNAELHERSFASLTRSLTAITHPAIQVRSVVQAPDGFSARFDALHREYRYFLNAKPVQPLVMADFCWHVPGEINVDAMREGAQYLLGEHDFKSFCLSASAQGKSTVRTIESITIEENYEIAGQTLIGIDIIGTAFLHSMVRTIAGTLLAVGREMRNSQWVADVVQACDRKAAGQTAPAKGLVFWKVDYPFALE